MGNRSQYWQVSWNWFDAWQGKGKTYALQMLYVKIDSIKCNKIPNMVIKPKWRQAEASSPLKPSHYITKLAKQPSYITLKINKYVLQG